MIEPSGTLRLKPLALSHSLFGLAGPTAAVAYELLLVMAFVGLFQALVPPLPGSLVIIDGLFGPATAASTWGWGAEAVCLLLPNFGNKPARPPKIPAWCGSLGIFLI